MKSNEAKELQPFNPIDNFKGNICKTGRPKGIVSEATKVKTAMIEAFNSPELGGMEGLIEYALKNDRNRRHFYDLLVKLLPKEVKLESNQDVNILSVSIVDGWIERVTGDRKRSDD